MVLDSLPFDTNHRVDRSPLFRRPLKPLRVSTVSFTGGSYQPCEIIRNRVSSVYVQIERAGAADTRHEVWSYVLTSGYVHMYKSVCAYMCTRMQYTYMSIYLPVYLCIFLRIYPFIQSSYILFGFPVEARSPPGALLRYALTQVKIQGFQKTSLGC